MVTSATFQPLQSVYRNYLSTLTDPFQRSYAAAAGPLAQLAYWAAPAGTGYTAPTGAETNPFASFLETGGLGGTAFNPLTSSQWQQAAQDVQAAIAAGGAGTAGQEAAALRFGVGNTTGADAQSQLANQANLVNAAVLARTPLALRGETQQILGNMFDRWQSAANTGNYLDQMQNVWGRFNFGPAAQVTSPNE